jgi:membrane protein
LAGWPAASSVHPASTKGPALPIVAILRAAWSLIHDSVAAWSDDYAPSMGAALAYYSLFSMAPLIVIAIAVAGLVFGEEAARGEILVQLQGLMGEDGAHAVQGLLASVKEPGEGILATLIGLAALVLGALGVFRELHSALNRIWRVTDREEGGLWRVARKHVLSFGMVMGLGFLLVVSLLISAALAALGRWWNDALGGWEDVAYVLNALVSLTALTTVYAAIYKVVPRVRLGWRDVWIGAGVTAILFSIGKAIIAFYLGVVGVGSGFGAAGSLAVLLVWLYYSAQIFLLGAEFTWVYAHRYGSMAERADDPLPSAVPRRSAPPTAPPAP